MKYKFAIPCSWEMCGSYYIEAEDLDEAIMKAENKSDLPEEQSYIDGSFQINYDCMEEANRVLLEKIYETPKDRLPLLIGILKSDEARKVLDERMKEL